MALVVITKPQGVDEEMYDAVTARMGDEIPDGMVIHTAGRTEDGVFQVIDVWESRAAHDRFVEERLVPAINAVMSEAGMDPMEGPPQDQTFYEAHNVMEPAAIAH